MISDAHDIEKTGELPSLQIWSKDSLPLVLVTIGDSVREFEALYDHLERISQDAMPKQQSLIVARPETPDVLYQTLRSRTREMPHVHLRRLGDDVEDCVAVAHETGTFYATPPRSNGLG